MSTKIRFCGMSGFIRKPDLWTHQVGTQPHPPWLHCSQLGWSVHLVHCHSCIKHAHGPAVHLQALVRRPSPPPAPLQNGATAIRSISSHYIEQLLEKAVEEQKLVERSAFFSSFACL
jgi:hypothetical protein